MATLTQSFLQGETVEEKYVLMRYLGGSDHSSVFQTQYGGVHPKDAAIKLLPAPPGNAEARLSGWRLAANISHPHLMRIIDMGRCEVSNAPMLFVVTELASENLSEILPERPLTTAEAQEMLASLLDALAFLHNRGFVHGHIKPSNIMAVGDDLKLSADTICRLGEVVENGVVPGIYDAPEGIRSGASSKADIWSLGVTLVEVLTQQKLDWAPSSRRDPVLPESIPPGFAEMARHCLRRAPNKRWTAATVQSHLPRVTAKPVGSRAAEGIAQAAPHVREALSRSAKQLPRVAHTAAKLAPKVRDASRALAPIAEHVSAQISKIPALIARTAHEIARAARKIEVPKIGVPHARKYTAGAAVLGVGLVAIAAGVKFAGRTGSHAAPPSVSGAPTIAVAKQVQPAAHETRSVNENRRRQAAARSERSRTPERLAEVPPRSATAPVVAESSPRPVPANTAAVLASPASSHSASASAGSASDANSLLVGRVLQRVLPDVPRAASNTIWGTVRVGVRVLVDASGNVTQAELQTAGPSRYFARLSVEAARKWQFAAPTQNGATVASVWLLHFGYRRGGVAVEPSQVHP